MQTDNEWLLFLFYFLFFFIIFFAKAKEPQNSKANTNVIQKRKRTEHKNRDNYYLNLINSDLKEEKDKEEVISEGREFQSEIVLGIKE